MTQEPISADAAIVERLRPLHRRWRRAVLLRGLARTFVVAVVALVVACAIDYLANLSVTGRVVLAACVYGAVAAYAWQFWLRKWLRPFAPAHMAWVLEAMFPQLNEKLISSVELAGLRDRHLSTELIREVLSEAEIDLDQMQPDQAFPITWRLFRAALAIAVLFAAALFVPPLRLPLLLSRLIAPSARDASVGALEIALVAPHDGQYTEGDEIAVEVKVSGPCRQDVELLTQDERVRRFLLTFDPAERRYRTTLPPVRANFLAWAQVGDEKSRTHTVTIVRRPAVDGFRIGYEFPAYTQLPPLSVETSTGDLKALKSTVVTLDVKSTKSLSRLSMTCEGETATAKLNENRLGGRLQFPLTKNGTYTLTLTDDTDLTNLHDLTYRMIAIEDEPPKVTLTKPETDLSSDPEEAVDIEWTAADDFGIATQNLVIKRSDGAAEQSVPLTPHDRTYRLSLPALKMQKGQHLELRLVVADAAGHETTSERRHVLVGGGRAFQAASAFLQKTDQLLGALKLASRAVTDADSFVRLLGSESGDAGEGREHCERMLAQKQGEIGDLLLSAQDTAGQLRALLLFPNSPYCAELTRLYLEQELLFTLPELEMAQGTEASDRLKTLTSLTSEMAAALKQKAFQHVASVEVPLMAWSLEAAINTGDLAAIEARTRETTDKSRLLLARSPDPVVELVLPPTPVEGQPVPPVDARAREFLNSLRTFAAANAGRMNDYARIDTAAKAIAAQLTGLEKQFRKRLEALRSGATQGDWKTVQEMANAARQMAAQADDPSRRADGNQVADVLDKAARDQDTKPLDALAESAAALARDQELQAMKQRLELLRREMAGVEKDLSAQGAQPVTAEETAARLRELDTLRQELSRAAGDARAIQQLQQQPELQNVAAQLDQAGQAVANARQAIENPAAPQTAAAAQQLQAAESTLDQAAKVIDDVAARREQEAEIARRRLDEFTDPASANVEQAREEVAKLAETLAKPNASFAAVNDELRQAEAQLARAAERLTEQAVREIAKPDGDLASAHEKAALAAMVNQARNDELAAARQTLAAAAAKAAIDGKDDQAAKALAQAQDAMQKAAADLARTGDLLRRHEEAADRQVPAATVEKVHEDILQAAEETLPREVSDSLRNLETLREARQDVAGLAKTSHDNENRADPAKTAAMAADAGQVKEELLATLRRSDPEAFEHAAAGILHESREKNDDLLRDVRTMKAASRDPARLPEAQTLARQMPEKEQKLADNLAYADAVNDMLGLPPADLQATLRDQVKPAIDEATRAVNERRDAQDALAKAGDALQNVDRRLDQLADTVSPALAKGEPATPLAASPPLAATAPLPDLTKVQQAADQLAGLQTRAETAENRAETIGNDLQKGRDETRKLVEALPAAGLDADKTAKLDKAQEALMMLPSDQRAAQLRDMSTWFNTDDKLGYQSSLQKAGAFAEQERPAEARRAELQNVVRQDAAEMERVAAAAQAELARNPAPATQAAAEDLSHFRQNVAARQFPEAGRNLEAFRENLRTLPTSPTEPAATPPPTPPASPKEQVSPPAVNPLAANDWNAAKGLALEAAHRDEAGSFAGSPEALKAAATGDFAKAAEAANSRAAAEFAKAAEAREAVASAEAPLPASFRQPREKLTADKEAAIAAKARQNPAALLAETRQLAEAAKQQAEQAAAAVQAGQTGQWPQQRQALADAVRQVEAARSALGKVDFPAARVAGEALADKPAATPPAEGQAAPPPAPVPDPARTPPQLAELAKTLDDYDKGLARQEAVLEDANHLLDKTAGAQSATSEAADAQRQLAERYPIERNREALASVAADKSLGNTAHQEAQALLDHGASMKPAEVAARFDHLASTVATELPRDEQRFRKAAEAVRQDDKIRQAAAGQEAQDQGARDAVAQLRQDMAARSGLPAAQAREHLDKAAEKLEEGQREEAGHELAQAAEALAAMKPHAGGEVPLNEAAYDATAAANALSNQDAVSKARAGDYQAAQDSMERMAQALPPGKTQDLAKEAARGFAEAREAQLDELPGKLGRAIGQVEGTPPLPAGSPEAGFLNDAVKAARKADLGQASVLLDHAEPAGQPAAPAVAALADAVKQAATAKEETVAQAPEPVREALKEIQTLRKDAPALPLSALGQAEQLVASQEFSEARRRMEMAAAAFQEPARKQEATILADKLGEIQRGTFGEMNKPAQEAVKSLAQPVPQAVEAARTQDYGKAAQLAEAAGEKTAAAGFREAREWQREQAPPAVDAGLKRIESALAALPKDKPEARATLEQAYDAALRNDLQAAANLARQAAEASRDDVDTARKLTDLANYAEKTVAPLKKAAEATAANRFELALDSLAQSATPPPAAARQALVGADAAADQALRNALEQSYALPDTAAPARQALNNTANALMGGRLDEAANAATQAGKDAGNVPQAVQDARGAADQAKQAVAGALEQASRRLSEATAEAAQVLQTRKAALEAGAVQADGRQQVAKTDAQLLTQAAAALKQNRPADAAKLLDESRAGKKLLPSLQDALQPPAVAGADPTAAAEAEKARQAAVQGALAQLDGAVQHANQAAQVAQAEAAQARQKAAQMNEAASLLQSGQVMAAAQKAGDAAGPALPAMQAMEAFDAAREAAAKEAVAESQPADSQKVADSAKSAGKSQGAANQKPSQEPAAAAPSAGENVAAAATNLQAGRNAIEQQQKATAQSTGNFNQAAERLDEAVYQAQQEALQATAGGGGARTGYQPPPGSGKDGVAGDAGDLGKSWNGVAATLASSDQQGRKNQYNTYYLQANQRYLEDVARESNKWQK